MCSQHARAFFSLIWMSSAKDSTDQQRWVWTMKVMELVWVKVNIVRWAELCRVHTAGSSRADPVRRAPGRAMSMARPRPSQIYQSEPDCTPISNPTEERARLCSTTCAPSWSIICITPSSCPVSSLQSLVASCWWICSSSLCCETNEPITEILTIWEDQWSKERLLALSMLCKHTSLEGHR